MIVCACMHALVVVLFWVLDCLVLHLRMNISPDVTGPNAVFPPHGPSHGPSILSTTGHHHQLLLYWEASDMTVRGSG